MKITKSASGKKEIRIKRSEWENIGKKAGWTDKDNDSYGDENSDPDASPYGDEGDLESGLDAALEQQKSVSEIILEQLGGGKFAVMTGAKTFQNTGNGLSFRLPGSGGFTKDGINYVKITLNSMDTYDMEFGRIRGHNYNIITTKNDIYNDILQDVFRDVTGLSTSL